MTRQERYESALKYLMSTAEGRRIILHWMSTAGVWTTGYTVEHSSTEFRAGMREVGLLMYKDLEHFCHEHLLMAMKEQHDEDLLEKQTADND